MAAEFKKWQVPKKGSKEERIVFDLMKTFASTLRKMPLYPPTHPIIKDSLIKLFLQLSEFFTVYGKVEFNILDNNILFYGQPLEGIQSAAKNLIADLKKVNIEGMTFMPGLGEIELGKFLNVLTLKPEAIAESGGLKALFAKENISHIIQSEVRYARIKEEEEIAKKGQGAKIAGGTDDGSSEGKSKDIVAEVSNFLSGKSDVVPHKESISFEFKKNARRLVKQMLKLIGPEKAIDEALKIIEKRFNRAGFTEEEREFYIEKLKKETIRLKAPKVSKKQLEQQLHVLTNENEKLKAKLEKVDELTKQQVEKVTEDLVKENRKVKKEKERINSVLKNVSEGLVIVDKEGKVLLLNPAAERLMGVDKEDKVGQHILEGLKEEQIVSFSKDKKQAIEIELAGPSQDTKKTLRASTAVIESEEGETIGMVSVLSDITKQKDLERMKDAFVSHVSHELRTPLISIQKSLGLILEGGSDKLDEQQKQFLEIASNNATRLTSLVNDLLDVAKLESGRMSLNYAHIKLGTIVDDTFNMVKGWADTRGVCLEKVGVENIELDADAKMLNQVFTNLIGNAIKFTPQGGKITVSAEVLDKGQLKISVSDTGCGIPAESLGTVFNKFEQVRSVDPQTSVKGTGLGLAIVKEIVELHGGTVEAESELGKGANFFFIIPKQKEVLDIRD